MNGRSPQLWPENIERIMKLGEGNGYAQLWESARKGPSLLAELAEKIRKDIDALTPEERIAFNIGWVRGRIRKYEEEGTVDPAEIAHAKNYEEFYRKKLLKILEKPSPASHPSHPSPREGTPEPTPAPSQSPEQAPEATAEAPSFSRYLKDILAGPERNNILQKLARPNGRLWIDRKTKNADGTERTVRIWLSLGLSPEERAKPEDALTKVIEEKLNNAAKNPYRPLPFCFRVDDLSAGNSWKEKWTAKKAGVSALVAGVAAAPEAERPAACARIAEVLFGTEEPAKPGREAFTALLQQYLTRPDGKTDIWTHVRNAYWHADGWSNETDADSLKLPSYASAKIRVWQKIGEEPRGAEIEGKAAPLFHNGTKYAAETIVKTVIADDDPLKGTWYHIGPHWVREEHLRISLRQNPSLPAGEDLSEGTFELMAWQVQQTPPTEGAAPPTTPPPEPKEPPPAAPPVPPAPPPKPPTAAPAGGSKATTDATPPEGSGAETNVTPKPVEQEKLNEEGFVEPTDENLQDEWLKAHTGTKLKLKLKLHAMYTPDPIPCRVARNQTKVKAGYVCLIYIKDGSRNELGGHFEIAEIRRLNLSPAT